MESYTVPGVFALADTIAAFPGGRVVIGVTSTPFKCPPAPSETALLMHDWLVGHGLRDTSSIAVVMPFGIPIPPSPERVGGAVRGLRRAGHRAGSPTGW